MDDESRRASEGLDQAAMAGAAIGGADVGGSAPGADADAVPAPVVIETQAEVPSSADAVAIGRLVDEILPLLIARFRAGHMGELEVRRQGWHVRVRRPADEPAPMAGGASGVRGVDAGRRGRSVTGAQPAAGAHPGGGQAAAPAVGGATGMAAVGPGRPAEGHGAAPAAALSLVATSPGVGYYSTREGIATGSQVRSGDVLGHVDVLGVRQEVVAPGDGIVARLLAEAGEAVEYGQDLVRLEPVSRVDPVREA